MLESRTAESTACPESNPPESAAVESEAPVPESPEVGPSWAVDESWAEAALSEPPDELFRTLDESIGSRPESSVGELESSAVPFAHPASGAQAARRPSKAMLRQPMGETLPLNPPLA